MAASTGRRREGPSGSDGGRRGARAAAARRGPARALTPAEGLLWEMLRDGRLAGLVFARRAPLRRYVLDFYCEPAGLVVQLVESGVRPDEPKAQRAERSARALEADGLTVLRVPEARVLADLPGVLAEIAAAAGPRRRGSS